MFAGYSNMLSNSEYILYTVIDKVVQTFIKSWRYGIATMFNKDYNEKYIRSFKFGLKLSSLMKFK